MKQAEYDVYEQDIQLCLRDLEISLDSLLEKIAPNSADPEGYDDDRANIVSRLQHLNEYVTEALLLHQMTDYNVVEDIQNPSSLIRQMTTVEVPIEHTQNPASYLKHEIDPLQLAAPAFTVIIWSYESDETFHTETLISLEEAQKAIIRWLIADGTIDAKDLEGVDDQYEYVNNQMDILCLEIHEMQFDRDVEGRPFLRKLNVTGFIPFAATQSHWAKYPGPVFEQ